MKNHFIRYKVFEEIQQTFIIKVIKALEVGAALITIIKTIYVTPIPLSG